MLETILVCFVGLLIGVDIAMLQRSNKKLRAELLALARKSSSQGLEIKLTCDNSQAMEKIAELRAAAESAVEAFKRVSGIVH